MLSKTYSIANSGLSPVLVEIEVDTRRGLPGQTIVGLPDATVKESRDRVTAAIRNTGYTIPQNQYITVNLAPADLKKNGSLYDLPIALGILASCGHIHPDGLAHVIMAGELGLNGMLKPIKGALLLSILSQMHHLRGIMLPNINAFEATLVKGTQVIPVKDLRSAIRYLETGEILNNIAPVKSIKKSGKYAKDFKEVRGQLTAKRALEIAAAGGHNVMLSGPPGCGKTMLAQRFPSILPPLTYEEMIEVTQIYSVAGKFKQKQRSLYLPPFRSPHHTISYAGLIGGAAQALPGEVSLAHKGVLFLDEMLEFPKQLLEVLRQPMEDRCIHISRAQYSVSYPADFIMIGSTNPCPCGFLNHPTIPCRCNERSKRLYRNRLSGPMADRFDLWVDLDPLTPEEILQKPDGEPSSAIIQRVIAARDRQVNRFNQCGTTSNGKMGPDQIDQFCKLKPALITFLQKAARYHHLSARALHRILRVARTISDLDESEEVTMDHLLEAISYRIPNNEGDNM